ncbi:MICOS complex subunit mic25-b-like [Entelurus aequoreus]|uniref:MICOS complex subunit mic25-b-like n=1 Tax=Entelurus aequoreus TaxID=161455 RepID=UPI002B1D6492|nr:MICOS complex subunit mic25-b-like [Entelurus aequoreus]
MGGNSPSHLHHGEGGGVTLVEGIRLSARVIKRMRQNIASPPSPSPLSSGPPHGDAVAPVTAPSAEHLLPLRTPPEPSPATPPQGPSPSSPPSVVTFYAPPPAESLAPPAAEAGAPPPAEPGAPPSDPPPPIEQETLTPPSDAHNQRAAAPTQIPAQVTPPPPAKVTPPPPPDVHPPPPAASPAPCYPATELAVVPTDGPPEGLASAPAEEPAAALLLPPDVEEEVAAFVPTAPPAAVSQVGAKEFEAELRQKIREEMQRSLQEEMEGRRKELQLQLEAMKAEVHAAARAQAEAQVEERVREADKAAYEASLSDAIAKERLRTEDDRRVMQLYAHQLEEKEEALKRRNALHKEHIVQLESKCAEFFKASSESFQKGKEETHRRFARFNIQPVCGDLQSQILKCYQEQPGKTLTCSKIASAYMQCVEQAQKSQVISGG